MPEVRIGLRQPRKGQSKIRIRRRRRPEILQRLEIVARLLQRHTVFIRRAARPPMSSTDVPRAPSDRSPPSDRPSASRAARPPACPRTPAGPCPPARRWSPLERVSCATSITVVLIRISLPAWMNCPKTIVCALVNSATLFSVATSTCEFAETCRSASTCCRRSGETMRTARRRADIAAQHFRQAGARASSATGLLRRYRRA